MQMGKRRRSDVNESEGEEPSTPRASHHHQQQTRRGCADRWSFPDELKSATHICQKLYDFLRKAKDSQNRLLCECLVRVPSRRSHPHYYDIVKSPIDLMRIQQKLKTEDYRYVHDFLADVRLLLDNARLFYDKSSDEVGCVEELEEVFTLRLQEYAGHFTAGPSDVSPPSLTLRIPKDQIRGLSSGKTGQSSSSSRQQLRTKVTRSKAWLQEYLASDDPLKMYLAAVYDHTDPAGVCVAEIFYELPSSKDYPEYYEVITEPVDLNIIKKNVEDGCYSNLRDIQEDMILMIKNAHYFNEPGSEIYKLASTLRKFIINHCVELERKYHTVPRPLKVSLKRPSLGGESWEEGGVEEGGKGGGETEDRKVPKLKVKLSSDSTGEVKVRSGSMSDASSSGGVKTSRRLSRSSKTSEDSDSVSSGDESSQSEEGGAEGEPPAKKTKLGAEREDPLTRLLKSRGMPPLKKQTLALYRHLVNHVDSHGRQTAELFMKKPSAKQYPEYYVVIQTPIDFREIAQKIKQDQYGNLEDVMSDVELLVNNALTFNEEGSTVYQDALTLRQLARDAAHKLRSTWTHPPHPKTSSLTPSLTATAATVVPPVRGRGRPRKNVAVAEVGGALSLPIQSPISSLFMAIKMFTLQGRGLWRSLQNQSSVGSEARKDFSTISMKIATGKFSSVYQLYQDLHEVFDHVCQTQPTDSLLHRDALILCRVAAKKYLDLTSEERKTCLYPNVQEAVQGMLKSILAKTLLCKDDASGTLPAESLRYVIMTREIPADGEEPPVTHKLSLSLMEKWVGRGHYRRLDFFQKDLLALLHHAGEKSKELCHSAMLLGQAYIQARDQVVGKKGSQLWSPALTYTSDDLQRGLASRLTPSAGEEAVEETRVKGEREGGTSGGKTDTSDLSLTVPSSAEPIDQLTVSDRTYRVGDTVYLSARNAGQKPHIVLIEKLWKDTSDTAWLQGCWYYRPEETFHLATRKFYEKEVFKSDFHSVALVSDIAGTCCVLVVRDYTKSTPTGFSEEDVFVCESRYTHKAKSFKKIKNWAYPPGHQPQLITRGTPISLSRVPSVFMTQSTRVTGSSSHSMLPKSDTPISGDKDLEPLADTAGGDPSLPFLDELENVKAMSVSNPTTGCVYYEQYCIDEDRFRLGDCVYVRSDQEKPFIARIDRMWTDANGDPWFHGPWFVYPEEVNHSPTRLFLEQELFMSSIQDTNPMRSIIGRCSVLSLGDYSRKRFTEFAEVDVFVVESKYQEGEGEIRKIGSGLKQFQLSREVQVDEVFSFQTEIQPRKVPSPKLLSHVSSPVTISPTPGLSAKQVTLPSQPSSSQPTTGLSKPTGSQVSSTGGSLPITPGVPPPTTVANVVNINPQLLQALLASASQASSTKPIIIPLQQSPINSGTAAGVTTPTVTNTPSRLATVTTSSAGLKVESNKSTPIMGYVCMWDECGEKFESLTDLTTHLMLNVATSHLVREMDGNFYCRWANCPRNPRHGGRAFDAMPKITRHVKEVHLLKLSQTALGLNPRSHVIQGQSLRPPAPPAPSVTPTTLPTAALSPFHIPSMLTSSHLTSSPLPVAHIPIVTPPPVPAASTLSTTSEAEPLVSSATVCQPSSSVTSAQSPLTSQSTTTTTATPTKPLQVSSLFLPPPPNRKPLVHSAIYTKYIQNLQRGTQHSSSLQTSDEMKPEHRPSLTQIQASDWLSPSAIPQSMSTTEALLTLRDHLLRDSFKLGQHAEQFQ